MNLTVSQWLQIIAIVASAAITISRWVWDAKRIKRDIQSTQTTNEIEDNIPRLKVGWDVRIAFFAPLGVLIWQTFRGGVLTRFDFGIMLLSSVLFLGFVSLRAGSALLTTISLQAFMARKLHELVAKLIDIGEVRAQMGAMQERVRQIERERGIEEGEQGADGDADEAV